MGERTPSDILGSLPDATLAATYDARSGKWAATLRGAILSDAAGDHVPMAAAVGPDAAVEALLQSMRSLTWDARILTGSGSRRECAWLLLLDEWTPMTRRPHPVEASGSPPHDVEGCLRALRLLAGAGGAAVDPGRWRAAVGLADRSLPGMREDIGAGRGPGLAQSLSLDPAVAAAISILKQDIHRGLPDAERWAEIAREAAKGIGARQSGIPDVDPELARGILDDLDDHRLGEGSPMSSAWHQFHAAARRAAPGYGEDVDRHGPALDMDGMDPVCRQVCRIIEASAASSTGIPPESVIDDIVRKGREALNFQPTPSR